MFGLGKIVGGIIGHIPGLKAIAPFIQVAVDACSGNWPGAALGVAKLAARIAPNSGFANLVNKFAPIASAFTGGGGVAGGLGSLFKSGRLSELFTKFKDVQSSFQAIKNGGDFFAKAKKVINAFKTAQSFVNDLKAFNLRSLDANRQAGLRFGQNIFPTE